MRLSSTRLPLDYRRSLRAQVHTAFMRAQAEGTPQRVELAYADAAINFNQVRTDLVYTIDGGTGRRSEAGPVARTP